MQWWVKDRPLFERLGADARIQQRLKQAGEDGLRDNLRRYIMRERPPLDASWRLQAVAESAISRASAAG
jgi:hypothetical protein